MSQLSLADWLEERRQNCLLIAMEKRGDDRAGWLEDESYFARSVQAVRMLSEASADNHANVPLRMYIALRVMRAWNSGTAGYDASVVITINDWIDGGMVGSIPWPESPFFARWAQKAGYARVGNYIGFKFDVALDPGIAASGARDAS